MEILSAPPGHPRTKPRALNVALPLARGVYTVVYDAEDVPDPDQLRLAVDAFAASGPEVACLQAHLAIDNTDDSFLTRCFTLEYAALFDVINPGLARLRLPVPLGGTSNHFRTEALRRIGGWDAWNVTEDADLGIRLARLGYCVGDLASTTHEEAPQTLRAWMHQRSRWMKGFVQTCVTHSRQPVATFRELGPVGFAGALTMTFGTVLSAVGYPIFTLFVVAMLVLGDTPASATLGSVFLFYASAALFALGAVAMLLPAAMSLRRRGLSHLWPLVFLLPFYYALVSAAAWRALWELAGDPFRWNKTEHGRARTSRTRQKLTPPSGNTG
jgi:cellulose synthase/poly-beta-1,6-N-acetylglucosamine synthase-like glycosyltransferase